jgi:hypothetical protein
LRQSIERQVAMVAPEIARWPPGDFICNQCLVRDRLGQVAKWPAISQISQQEQPQE